MVSLVKIYTSSHCNLCKCNPEFLKQKEFWESPNRELNHKSCQLTRFDTQGFSDLLEINEDRNELYFS